MYGPARGGDGWRARIGVVIPSMNTTVEGWFPKVAPDGVTFHVNRMPLGPDATPDAVAEMARHEVETTRLLVDCEPDVILYACTGSTLVRGRAADLALMRELTDVTGVPCCTTTEAIVRALREFDATTISIASPYPVEIDEIERQFFGQCGVDVAGVTSLGIKDNRELADPSPGEVYRLARSAFVPGSDALLATCLAMRSHYIAAQLEADLGVPVITSAQATLWAGLRLAGVNAPITGYGALLERPGSDWAAVPRTRVRDET